MSKPKNPYKLIAYKQGMSSKNIALNNSMYWNWEIKYNGFVPPNSKQQKK